MIREQEEPNRKDVVLSTIHRMDCKIHAMERDYRYLTAAERRYVGELCTQMMLLTEEYLRLK